MVAIRSILPLTVVAGLMLMGAACGTSEDPESACVRASGAEVCADIATGSAKMRAEGLKPGSELTLDASGLEPQTYTVGDNGQPDGAVGFLGGDASGPFVIIVAGTAANGDPVEGEIDTRKQ